MQMTEEVKEVKTRKPSTTTFMIEVLDAEGNIVENASEKNMRIVKSVKKVDASVIDLIKEHPHAFFINL